jgi:vanillate O-demethylase monooxygenase subunit
MARNFRLDDQPFSKKLLDIGIDLFNNEDKPMIEAQQAAFGDTDDLLSLKPVLLSTDGPSVRARRTVLRLVEQEQVSKRSSAAADVRAVVG